MRRVHRSVLVLSVCLLAGLVLATGLAVSPADAGPRRKRLTPKQEALIELGRRLFFDPLVSRSGKRSCASCHDPDHGFSDPGRVSDDDFGRTRRHSQTLLDGHLNPTAHWDGEFERVEELVLARVGALKGRKSKLGHGVTLLDALQNDPASSFGDDSDDALDDEEDVEEEEDILDDDDETGGGDDDDDVYGGGGEARAPSGAAPRDASKPGEAPKPGAAPPAAPAQPKPQAAEPKDPKQADPKKQNDAGAEEEKRPSPEELRKKADELRKTLRKLPLAAHRLERAGLYREGFEAAFGSASVSTARIARAIGAYCRSIESTPAPYDRYAAGDESALSAAAVRGMALFRGRAGCASCHTMSGRRPTFTDFDFHNTGVTWNGLSAQARALLGDQREVFQRKKDDLETPRKVDEGRARISTLRRDLRAFKTPTLRDVARRGPYMHDGRFKTLADVVRYYAAGGSPDPVRSADVHAFAASERDVADLVAFLESLTGDERPGLPARAWRTRAESTRLRFVDADGKPLEGLVVRLTPVGDVAARELKGLERLESVTTDERGWVGFPRTHRTHVRITLPGDLSPVDGALVPDTCRKARIVVPVRGKTVVVVRMPVGAQAPRTIVAEHQGTVVLPGHKAPRTRLARTHAFESGGAQVVRYEGWLRTDVPALVEVRVPGLKGRSRAAVLSGAEAARIDVVSASP